MPHNSTRGEEIDGLNLRSNKMRNTEKNMLNRMEKGQTKVILNIKATHMLPNLSKNGLIPCLSSTHVLLIWNHILVSLLIHLLMDQFVIDATKKPMAIIFPNGIIWTLAPNLPYSTYLLKLKKLSLLVSSQFYKSDMPEVVNASIVVTLSVSPSKLFKFQIDYQEKFQKLITW